MIKNWELEFGPETNFYREPPVKGQGRQYPQTADLDLGPGSGLISSLQYQPSLTTVCKQHAHPQPVTILI